MKQKILEALKQGHKNLGLSDEAFERVADLGKTFITSEEQIPNFVKGAEAILKAEQSAADKARTKANEEKKALEAKVAELEAKLNDVNPQEGNEPPKGSETQPQDMAKLIAAAVAEAVKPLTDEINAFKSGQAAKQALADAESTFKANGWVGKYPDEANDAWDRTIEYNELTGSKMTAEELAQKALGYFAKVVARKGEDVSKPFKGEGEGQGGDDVAKAKEIAELLKGGTQI